MIRLSDIKPNPENPRVIKDDKFKKLVKSIEEFPKMMALRPMVIDEGGVVLGGNMRLKALQEVGYDEIPEEWVKKASDLTKEEARRFIIADNVGFGEWEWDLLNSEWSKEELEDWGLDVPGDLIADELSEEYSAKIGEVIYEPKISSHRPEDLFTRETAFDEEIEDIEDEQIKEMLKARAAFFSSFNYSKIADYYAYQATAEEKEIFEKLALVILDKDQLIENGFSKIIETVLDENEL